MAGWFETNKHLYPTNWDEIANRIKELAGWKCEACGAKHGSSPRILTVDHLDHSPRNCADDNLMALCQKCHLRRQGLYPPAATKDEAIRRLAFRAEMERNQMTLPGFEAEMRRGAG